MSQVTVVATVVAKKNCIDAVKAELLKLIAPTRNEDGCSEYRLHQDNDDPARFIFYENWESPDCLAKHMNSAHIRNYVAAVGDLLMERTVHKLTEVG